MNLDTLYALADGIQRASSAIANMTPPGSVFAGASRTISNEAIGIMALVERQRDVFAMAKAGELGPRPMLKLAALNGNAIV